jgi:hypothetical protein
VCGAAYYVNVTCCGVLSLCKPLLFGGLRVCYAVGISDAVSKEEVLGEGVPEEETK